MNDWVMGLAVVIAVPLWAGLIYGLAEERWDLAGKCFMSMFPAAVVINVLDSMVNPGLMEVSLGQALCFGSMCLALAPVAILLMLGMVRSLLARRAKKVAPVRVNLQEGLGEWDLQAWDRAIIQAAEIMEQRKYGRQRGEEFEVTLRADADWGVWRHAAEIWKREQTGDNEGVYVIFEDGRDLPVVEGGALVMSVRKSARG